jgi:hypothetical protein
MSGQARVESIEPLKALRRTLFKFAESANTAISDAESELTRTLMWIQTEQTSYWTMQIRKRTELVSRCAEAVRMKQLFKDSTGRTSSAIDEVKALDAAKRSLVVAHEKLAACKSWSRKMEKEIQNYRGTVQRFATTVQSDLPVVAAKLENAIIQLEQYVALGVPIEQASTAAAAGSAEATTSSGLELPSMARPADESEEAKPDEKEEP